MSRTFAIMLSLLCIVSPPAFAQGTVRQHGDPPAPKPTPDGDQRRGARENDPVQWEVRNSIGHCVPLMISNLRREGLSRPSLLTPSIPETRWSDDGGDWFVAMERGLAPLAPCRMGNSNMINPNQPTALFSNRNKRYLTTRLTFSESPQLVWNIKRKESRTRGGVRSTRFAIYSIVDRRFLMLCHDEADPRKNNEKLCYYNTDQERPE